MATPPKRNPNKPAHPLDETEMNQCDGCRRGAPLVNGIHDLTGTVGSYPGEKMACTKGKYIAEVTTIHKEHFRDIVAMLRKVAAQIEAGEHNEAKDAVLILETDKGVQVFGWGKAEIVASIGLVELGKAKLFQIWQDIEKQVA